MFIIVLILPVFVILWEIDPFYFVFEICLPSIYERELILIVTIPLVRFCLGFLCVFEFCRFVSNILFVFTCVAFTALNCLKELTKGTCSQKVETTVLKLYTEQLIWTKSIDYFIRYVVVQFLITAQVLIVTMIWMVLKCWDLLPGIISFAFGLAAGFSTVAIVTILPVAVEICESSRKFVKQKAAVYHTFNRRGRNCYFYLRWKSQTLLAIRFGVQFTLSKKSFLNYFEVLMTNLTNSILLLNP